MRLIAVLERRYALAKGLLTLGAVLFLFGGLWAGWPALLWATGICMVGIWIMDLFKGGTSSDQGSSTWGHDWDRSRDWSRSERTDGPSDTHDSSCGDSGDSD